MSGARDDFADELHPWNRLARLTLVGIVAANRAVAHQDSFR